MYGTKTYLSSCFLLSAVQATCGVVIQPALDHCNGIKMELNRNTYFLEMRNTDLMCLLNKMHRYVYA